MPKVFSASMPKNTENEVERRLFSWAKATPTTKERPRYGVTQSVSYSVSMERKTQNKYGVSLKRC